MEFSKTHYSQLNKIVGLQMEGTLFSNPMYNDEDLHAAPRRIVVDLDSQEDDSYIKMADELDSNLEKEDEPVKI